MTGKRGVYLRNGIRVDVYEAENECQYMDILGHCHDWHYEATVFIDEKTGDELATIEIQGYDIFLRMDYRIKKDIERLVKTYPEFFDDPAAYAKSRGAILASIKMPREVGEP